MPAFPVYQKRPFLAGKEVLAYVYVLPARYLCHNLCQNLRVKTLWPERALLKIVPMKSTLKIDTHSPVTFQMKWR
jgi:hypothetical protein